MPRGQAPALVLGRITVRTSGVGCSRNGDFVDGRSFAPLLEGGTHAERRTTALIENRRSKKLRRPAYAGLITQSTGSDASKDTAYVEYDGAAGSSMTSRTIHTSRKAPSHRRSRPGGGPEGPARRTAGLQGNRLL
jgi:hypothetical protein